MAFTVLYDANVLYPAPLRDLLVQLALTDLFRARWTDLIHDEWTRNVLEDRSDLDAQKLHRVRDLMNQAVPDCLVTGFEALVPALELPDPDDRHVLAAAIVAGAQVIVTFNLSDFPARVSLEFAELPTPSFPSYPLPEHFAEKFHAYTRPRSDRTRVKDLVDLTLIAEELGLEPGQALARVIEVVFARYGTHPLPAPDAVEPPPESWREPYRAMAEELG